MTICDEITETQNPPEGDFLAVDGWSIHSVTLGRGADVIMIHGAGGSTKDMTFNLAPKVAKFARVIVIDRPAHGHTTGEDEMSVISPQEQADLIWKFCDAKGIKRPVILGQSYGGSVALAMALQRPEDVRALCLVSAVITDTIPSGAQSIEMLTRLEYLRAITLATVSSKRFLEMGIAKIFAPQDAPEGYTDHLGLNMTFRERTFRHQMLQASSLGDHVRLMMPEYDGLDMPIEIVHGTADTILDHDRHSIWLADLKPDARLTLLDGVGHMPHIIDPEEVSISVFRALLTGCGDL